MTETTTSQLPGCKQCGKPLTRKSRGPKPTYCSASCRAKAGAERAKADGRYEQWIANSRARKQAEREANAKPCRYCGDLMLNPYRIQCGKPECKRKFNAERMREWNRNYKAKTGTWYVRKWDHRRRMLLRVATLETFHPSEVFERDRWICQICKRPVDATIKWPDPMSPSLDHIVPISEGGEHTRANCRLAHLRCNTARGNRGGGEQLALIG